MHRLQMTALAGVLALSTSGSESSKMTFQPDLSVFFHKNPDQATSQNPATLVKNQQPQYPTGLIETTDIQQRLKQLQQGQSDPFTRLFPPQLETATKPEKVFPDLPKLPVKKELPVATVKPTVKVPPNTRLAKGVAVEGVVQIGDETHAIVKLPTDGTSRYVSEGQLLSGGQLLVKRIEISPYSEPMVILEQNGIEVAKTVGETDDTDTIASSTLSQIDNEKEASNEQVSSSETSTDLAEKRVKATQPTEEYTAAIPVPLLPKSPSSQKKSFEQVAIAPSPINSVPSTDIATSEDSGTEDFDNSERVSLNSQSEVKRDGRNLAFRLRHRAQHQLEEDSFANQPDTSSFDLSENQPEYTASSNTEDSTRKQQLVDRLRSGNKAPAENRVKSNSRQALQTDLETKADQQQPISDQLGYKKRLATSNEHSTTVSNIEVLAHRQWLINELRGVSPLTNP